MLWKFGFICAFFLVGLAFGSEDGPSGSSSTTEGQVFTQEVECSKAGGLCLAKKDCPADRIAEGGHCPKQSHLDAVCCHSLSMNENRCVKLGGQCLPSCDTALVLRNANDCPEGQTCCPLV